MFQWEFAKSVEVMFSRWAIKRICKFLLKKRLGDFILGDIDLDQLDVQLSRGTIQLSDLALNVDYLNQKLAGGPVMVKEGSIGSLSIKIPWKLKNCQIEVEELELILAPCAGSNIPSDADCWKPNHDSRQQMNNDSDKHDLGTCQGSSGLISLDVHEGVKTIAKIVKWFLTSFHVRLKNLIVAFDPCSDIDEKRSVFPRTLVVRIAETEYGTCVSEDATAVPHSKLDCLFGMAKLTNFITFRGAVVEFLEMDAFDNGSPLPTGLGTSFSEWYTGSSLPGCTTTVLTGASGGFSGTLKLSIPWKNGSLDIRKVDADVFVDPVELRIQPSTIKWMIFIWESLKNVGTAGRSHVHYKATDSSCHNSKFYSHSSTLSSAVLAEDRVSMSRGNFSGSMHSPISQNTLPDALLQRTNVIHNWVPLSINQKDKTELEPDYGASIDQFFECLDELRSSQSSLGNSGIWNWTCSVFNAITAASNLASGSGHIPTEQLHVETNLQASITEISLVLSFHDEEQKNSQDLKGGYGQMNKKYGTEYGSLSTSNTINPSLNGLCSNSYMSYLSSTNIEQSSVNEISPTCPNVHYLEARCQNVVLNLKIFPQKMKFEASVMHIKVDDYCNSGSGAGRYGFPECKNSSYDQMTFIQKLQGQVQGALPPFPFSFGDHDSEETSIRSNMQCISHSILSQEGLVKLGLLQSFGVCSCQYAVSSTDSDGRPMTSTSIAINLPPFMLWLDFHLVKMLLNLFKQVETFFEEANTTKDFRSDALGGRHNSSPTEDVKSGTCTYITTVYPKASLQVNLVLPHARFILCFPSEYHQDFRHLSSWDKFIILEFSPSTNVGKVPDALPVSKASSPKGHSCTPSTSIHLNIENFDTYLVTSANKDALDNRFFNMDRQLFSAVKILSVTNRADDHQDGITILWQKGPVTGPWMASRAWSLATSHDERTRNKVSGKGCEFTSVTPAEDFEETSSHIRQEMILSSAVFLHARFSLIRVNLGSHDFIMLHHLLNQVMSELSCGAHGTNTADESINDEQSPPSGSNGTQASILVECVSLDFCITLDETVEASCSIQKELQGSWNSFGLTVENFELLSVSNIGGISDTNFFWLNHGEGELRGSIISMNEDAVPTQDYLLIACRNSTRRRGDGEGANALSSGSAGTAITHLQDPQSSQSFMSITARYGTIVAPGGRLDWINTICFFLSLPLHENENAGNDGLESRSSEDVVAHRASFFLDMVDIALSYEPPMKNIKVNAEMPDIECSSATKSTAELGERYVACLLAAASLNLSNHTMANSATNDYKIQLQDVGLLISELSGSGNNRDGYHVGYLQKTGYVKVAQLALVEAVLRTYCWKDLLWEIECAESHINMDTCHDTTSGLVRLISQLQQLYAPDVEDALVHLQSRWNTIQQVQTENNTDNLEEILDSSSFTLNSEKKLSTSDEDSRSVGLMDAILENVFYVNGECKPSSDYYDIQSHISLDGGMPRHGCNLNTSTQTAGDLFSLNVPLDVSMHRLEMRNSQAPPVHKIGTPQIIESYCISDLFQPSKSTIGNHSSSEDNKCKFGIAARKDIECGKGGWYKDGSLMLLENHISNQPGGKQLHQEGDFADSDPAESCRARGRIFLKNIDVRWRMYSGSDWSKARENPLYSSKSNGRDGSVCLELTLSGVNLQNDIYPDGVICVSKLSVSVQNFHLYDSSKDAPWKLVLGYYHSKDHPRESCAKAFKLDLEVIRPDPLTPLEDYRLRLAFLPMRLHLDQGQLNFLISFFSKDSSEESPSLPNDLGGSEMSGARSFGSQTIIEEALLPFFQKCDVCPIVVRVDYIPRHIDLAALRGGNYAELLNLVRWKEIDLQLKHVQAVGVYGWSSLCERVVGEWLEDISRNQVHKLLKGLAPIRSLFAVSSGTSKLVSLPVKSYRKDHKLLKGMQRGAIAFIKSISLEAVGLGVHLAAGAHDILLQTEYILTSIPPSVQLSERSRGKTNVRSNQPKDAQQGIQQAYESLSDGLGRTASALVGTPLKTYQRGAGAGSVLATAVRAVPGAAIAPVTASARAAHCALLGVRNSLDPKHKKESMEKYLGSRP